MRTSELKIQKTTVVLCNAGTPVDSDWGIQSDGSYLLDQNMASKAMVFPVAGLNAGDIITGFRILGSLGAGAGNSTTIDADLRRNLKAAGSITDASVGAIAQTTVNADTALDIEKAISGEGHTVAEDYQYYVNVTGSTANNAVNDIYVTGIEVDVIKKFGDKN